MNSKLELTWIGKNNKESVEPRILVEDKDKSYGDNKTENMLIHGDNLLGLKALESQFSGKIKCIYIDPPYNTGTAQDIQYDDNLEHSTWLSLMKERLLLLRNLLSDNGLIFISIDNKEHPYLQILCDEVFGRNNFRSNIVWKKVSSAKAQSNFVGNVVEYILCYSKTADYDFYPIYLQGKSDDKNYPYVEEETNRRYGSFDFTQKGQGEAKMFWGEMLEPPKGKHWIWTQEKIDEGIKNGLIFKTKSGIPRLKRYLDTKKGNYISDLWDDEEVNPISANSKEALNFFGQKSEGLIRRILTIATKEGDYVLDSFLGSGTTISVAHKMHRRWIGIEMGNQCYDYCIPRINKVIDGIDKSGITSVEKWEGGGGYKFYELAPTLIKEDSFGEPIINKDYNPEMLARAVALHEGFEYSPDKQIFWKQSKGNENSFLYVTTQFLELAILDKIHETMSKDEYLIIACSSYDESLTNKYKNIMIKKIPETLLKKCKFNVANYNLNVVEVKSEEECDEE